MKKLLLSYLRHFPLSLGKYRIAKKLGPKFQEKTVFTNSHQVTFEIDPTEYIQRQLFLYGIYERNTIRHILKLVKPNMIFFDVGTNIGAYSLMMARHLPQGTVYSFEPLSINYNRFLRNLSLNDFKNVKPLKLGLSDHQGTAEIYYSTDQRNLGAASLHSEASQHRSETIQLTTLDDFCAKEGIVSVDILKVDVEGAEKAVLDGAKKTLADTPKMILVMELMDQHLKKFGSSSRQIFDHLTSLGFKAYKPSGWPMPLKQVKECPPESYNDNLIFLKGY